MNRITALAVFFSLMASLAQAAGPDPAQQCRQAHAADPQAHIACLEQALKAYSTSTPEQNASAEAATVLGSEQVQQKQRASGKVVEQPETVRIVESRYNSAELGFFKLDNGQIWGETEESPYHLRLKPSQTYVAVIERGTLGGYRMYVEGIKRMLKVERIK